MLPLDLIHQETRNRYTEYTWRALTYISAIASEIDDNSRYCNWIKIILKSNIKFSPDLGPI